MTGPCFQLSLSLHVSSCLPLGVSFELAAKDDGVQRFRIVVCGCRIDDIAVCSILVTLGDYAHLAVAFPLLHRGGSLIPGQCVAAAEGGGLLQLGFNRVDSFFQIQRADDECISVGGGGVCIAVVYITSPGIVQGHGLAAACRHHAAVLNGLPLGAILPRDSHFRLQIQCGKRYRIVIGYGRRTDGLHVPLPCSACRARCRSHGVAAHKG